MKTAAEYRAMADECFKWAREAQTKEVRKSYLQLAQIWLNTASKIDSLPPTQSPLAPDLGHMTQKMMVGCAVSLVQSFSPPKLASRKCSATSVEPPLSNAPS